MNSCSIVNVLFIEDNEADCRAVKEAFSSVCANAELYTAKDAKTGLEFIFGRDETAPAFVPDLVLLDLNLPGMSGRDILKAIKNDSEKGKIPVIIFSSSSSQEDINEAYALGANCYLNKPLRYTELIRLFTLICDFWLKEVRFCGAK